MADYSFAAVLKQPLGQRFPVVSGVRRGEDGARVKVAKPRVLPSLHRSASEWSRVAGLRTNNTVMAAPRCRVAKSAVSG